MEPAPHNPYRAPSSELGEAESLALREQLPIRLASRVSRLAAMLIDWFLQLVVFLPLQWGVSIHGGSRFAPEQRLLESGAWTAVALVIYVVLHGYLLVRRGQTIGKLALRIRVIDARDRTIPPLGRLLLRRILPFQLATLIPDFWLVVLLLDDLFIFRDEQRCLHDYLAGTIVVRRDFG